MFQTPVAEKKRRSLTNDPEVVKTPGGSLSASVMSTPEESGSLFPDCGVSHCLSARTSRRSLFQVR